MSSDSSAGNEQAFAKLTEQEKHVLLLMSNGRSDEEIAKAFFLGEGTIRNYINSILTKLGLADRVEATAYAVRHDLRGHLGYHD